MIDTKEYYETNALQFIESTISCDMSIQYNLLLKYIKSNSTILDVGFGSGRDMINFKNNGFIVKGIDITHKFVENGIKLGLDVEEKSVLDINYCEEFDAIWACASLLHLSIKEIELALLKLYNALKNNGYMYMSFKLGEFNGERNGRYFTDLTLNKLIDILSLTKFTLVESLITNDVRPEKKEQWLNVVVKK